MFDQTGIMEDESVIFIEGQESYVRFNPIQIIEVTNYDKTVHYMEGKDYVFIGRKIVRTYHSRIPKISDQEYWGEQCDSLTKARMKQFRIERPRYSEEFFTDHQVLISYCFKKEESGQIFGINVAGKLERTIGKIKEKQSLDVLLYGDSISKGMTSSAIMNKPPYRKNFFDQLCDLLQKQGCVVTGINNSESGMGTEWALEKMGKLWSNQKADLCILGWGMNDATELMTPKKYRENLEKLLNDRPEGSDCLIITPMLANPDSKMIGRAEGFATWQDKYFDAVKPLASREIGILDMAYIHKRLLEGKKYADMTGNNINHPNDFLISVYFNAIRKFLQI